MCHTHSAYVRSLWGTWYSLTEWVLVWIAQANREDAEGSNCWIMDIARLQLFSYLLVAFLWCQWYHAVFLPQFASVQISGMFSLHTYVGCMKRCIVYASMYLYIPLSFTLCSPLSISPSFINHQLSITLHTHTSSHIHSSLYSNSLTSTPTPPKPSGPQRKGVWNIHTHILSVHTHTQQQQHSCVILHHELGLWEASALLDLKQWEGYEWVPREQGRGERGEEVKGGGIRRIQQLSSTRQKS